MLKLVESNPLSLMWPVFTWFYVSCCCYLIGWLENWASMSSFYFHLAKTLIEFWSDKQNYGISLSEKGTCDLVTIRTSQMTTNAASLWSCLSIRTLLKYLHSTSDLLGWTERSIYCQCWTPFQHSHTVLTQNLQPAISHWCSTVSDVPTASLVCQGLLISSKEVQMC